MSIKFLKLTLIGFIAGLWLTFSKGTFFILLCAFIIFLVLKRLIPKEDIPFVFKVIIIGLTARIALAILYYYFYLSLGYPDVLGPDGEAYSQRGWYISQLLLNQNPCKVPNTKEFIFNNYNSMVEYYKQKLPPMRVYQVGIFTYFIGILYAICNYSPLMIKLINSALSALTGIIIYFIGREIFNSKVGKISMALLIFLPSIFVFSITALKDSLTIFLLTSFIWLLIKFQKTRNIICLTLALIITILVDSLRSLLMYPLLLLLLFSLLISLRMNIFKKTILALVVFIFFISIPSFVSLAKRTLDPENFFSSHIGYINTTGNNYKIFPDRCYYQSRLVGIGPIEIIEAFIKGTFHLFCEPLPQRLSSKAEFLAFSQTILLYLFMPFVILGLCTGLRYKPYQMMPLTMYLIIFIPLVAISEGNVGTVFRHRDIFMPFLILLGVIGYYAKLGKDNSDLIK